MFQTLFDKHELAEFSELRVAEIFDIFQHILHFLFVGILNFENAYFKNLLFKSLDQSCKLCVELFLIWNVVFVNLNDVFFKKSKDIFYCDATDL